MTAPEMLATAFATLPDLIRAHAAERPTRPAIVDDAGGIDYAALDRRMDRIATALQRDGIVQGDAVAILSTPSIDQACIFLGALRAGCCAAPIAPSATPMAIAAMIADCGARIVFCDAANAGVLADQPVDARIVTFGSDDYAVWLGAEDARPAPVMIAPDDAFNIIYSSGTTGIPKGIVQSHAMRWQHLSRNAAAGFGDAVTMIATPLYSNTTLVSFLPTIGWGGTAVLMAKFDARRYLELAERHGATHTMLVPVQYQRIMAVPDFDRFDLSRFRFKTCTSAPFSPTLKADILARWPGLLVEYYGMTEGGASCALNATAHPDKLHTVGQPMPGHEIRLIDDNGHEVADGEAGEIVGRSAAMMNGYHGRADATRAAEWHDADGRRYIRHGDIGRFDDDGFLILMDRKKDLVISGGYNIYPSDLEAVLAEHPDVADCAVLGMPSEAWGETPVGVFVPRGPDADPSVILGWTNDRLGRTQRLSRLIPMAELPRSAIGKILKRSLRDQLEMMA
ncbi:4-coumarate--CoA ligase [Sphingomonas sp. Leaf17]|uniref:class I adenylate-forming enzyme family protein n=1 Tax=Sphingomonas sp. Leaf17 TaxID=1735683 RepID=UPI0006F43800|nr:class I adenylate-forming enzyme family protein [Sphingomonas sp. Leaf17]KQM65141.1 4-coumarate--CoA ligase [Sphingomonas sp. Leaf17]